MAILFFRIICWWYTCEINIMKIGLLVISKKHSRVTKGRYGQKTLRWTKFEIVSINLLFNIDFGNVICYILLINTTTLWIPEWLLFGWILVLLNPPRGFFFFRFRLVNVYWHQTWFFYQRLSNIFLQTIPSIKRVWRHYQHEHLQCCLHSIVHPLKHCKSSLYNLACYSREWESYCNTTTI